MQLNFKFDHDLSNAVLSQCPECWGDRSDTETMGCSHRDRLCLVQLCDPEGRVTVIRIAKQKDAPNLKQLMEADGVLKVSLARFTTLRYHLGIQVAPIFCTKIGKS